MREWEIHVGGSECEVHSMKVSGRQADMVWSPGKKTGLKKAWC